jgi:hypothetical protein
MHLFMPSSVEQNKSLLDDVMSDRDKAAGGWLFLKPRPRDNEAML